MNIKVDIVIVGGGVVGASFAALMLANTKLTVALIDQQPLPQHIPNDPRVSAIGPHALQCFKKLNVFDRMKQMGISPYTGMSVFDGQSAGEVHFQASAFGMRELGYIIENSLMQSALHETLANQPRLTRFMSVTPEVFSQTQTGVCLTLNTGEVIEASLGVAADGARSWLREKAGLTITVKDEQEAALIARVSTTKPHEKMARQLFLSTGPLAFLPLIPSHEHSIVWSLPKAIAHDYLALSQDAFNAKLSRSFEHRLGEVITSADRQVFPLLPQQASAYVGARIALLGDAAHTVHPLAGLGVNLGLRDATNLAMILTNAALLGKSIADQRVLRQYARRAAAENQPVLSGIDWIKRCFAVNQPAFQVLRGMGMNLTERLPLLKKGWVKAASFDALI